MDAEIFDLDGTLCDVTAIRHLISGKVRNFRAFHRESVNCPANPDIVKAAHEAREAGRAVLVVTARDEEHDAVSSWWLLLNDVPFDEMFMRKHKDNRKDYEVKKDILAKIRARGYNIVKAHEDNPNVKRLWEEEGIPVNFVEGYGFDGDNN